MMIIQNIKVLTEMTDYCSILNRSVCTLQAVLNINMKETYIDSLNNPSMMINEVDMDHLKGLMNLTYKAFGFQD